MTKTLLGAALSALVAAGAGGAADAQSLGVNGAIGTIGLTAAGFCPEDTLDADGRILRIHDEPAVFSLVGPTHGGDGISTFALPDLRGKEPVPGLRYCVIMRGVWPTRP